MLISKRGSTVVVLAWSFVTGEFISKQAMTPVVKPAIESEGQVPPVQGNEFEEEEENFESVLGTYLTEKESKTTVV